MLPDGWGDCTEAQPDCRDGAERRRAGSKAEATDGARPRHLLLRSNLAVPARRDIDDAEVLRGKQLFYEAAAPSCHTPKFVTAATRPTSRSSSFQLIWPYTDLLLHDMGEGLADDRPEGEATAASGARAPLWGIGLTETRQRAHLLPARRARAQR